MEAELFDLLFSAVSGPSAAVVICLIIMWKGYKLIVEKMLPAQAKMVQEILEEHRKDRKVFVDSIVIMDKRLSLVEEDISEIKHVIREN